MVNIGFISTLSPTRCGIASYSKNLTTAIRNEYKNTKIFFIELLNENSKHNNFYDFNIQNEKPKDFIKAAEYIQNSPIDIIDIQHEFKIFGKPDGENVKILLRKIKKPIISTLHTVQFSFSDKRRLLFNELIDRSQAILLFSEEAKDHIIGNYHIEAAKITVIPHGVPLITLNDLHRNISENENNLITFVSAGFLRTSKGYDISLRALQSLKKKGLNFKYIIIGIDHPESDTAKKYRQQMVELVVELGLNDNVLFINKYLSDKILIEKLMKADIFLLPYENAMQSSSGILSTMLACGRPIVTTPFQYAISCVANNSGEISRSTSHTDFALAIEKIIARKSDWSKIIHYNNSIGQLWNWANVAELYYNVYRKVIQSTIFK